MFGMSKGANSAGVFETSNNLIGKFTYRFIRVKTI